MRGSVLLPFAFVLLWAASASAIDDYDRNGVILGMAGTYAIDAFSDQPETGIEEEFGGPAHADVGDSLGINGNIGYRFHPHLSAAVEAEWVDGFRSDISVTGWGDAAEDRIASFCGPSNAPLLVPSAGGFGVRLSASSSVGCAACGGRRVRPGRMRATAVNLAPEA